MTNIKVIQDPNTCNKARKHHPICVRHFHHLTFQAAKIIDPIIIAPAKAITTE